MKKVLITVYLLFGCLFVAWGQFNPKNITIGGGLGLQFGDYTLINVSPQVGYNFGKYFNLGGGISYTYFKEKYSNDLFKQTNSYLGVNAYSKLYPVNFLVIMIQPEISRMWKTIKNMDTNEKKSTDKLIPSCVIGIGLRFGMGTAMLKYDLAQNNDSPYGSRVFYSVGYTFGF